MRRVLFLVVVALLPMAFTATPPSVQAADAKLDAAAAMKRAPAVLKEILTEAKKDKRLAPRAKQKVTVEEYKTGFGLCYETADSWPDLPSKPKGPAPGNGSVQVKLLRGTAKTGLDTPFFPPKGCHYALSIYGTSVPGVQVSIWSMTSERAAHGRLVALIRTRLKVAGITMDEKPLSPTVTAGDTSDGPTPATLRKDK